MVNGTPTTLHRSPQAASVLDARTLRDGTAPSLDAALRVLPGVDRDRSNAPFTNYGQLRLSFAGAGADRGALLVDGVPAQNGFGGQVNWNALPADAIVRGELLRGPGSALYGSGAIGGVLALQTRIPVRTREGNVQASAGGIDRGSAGAYASLPLGSSWAVNVSAQTRSFGYDVIPAELRSAADRTARSTADVARVRARRTGARTTFDASALVAADAQEDGRPNNGFTRSTRQAAATWTAGSITALALTVFARDERVVPVADVAASPGKLLYTQHVPSSDAGVRLRYDLPAAGGTLAAIFERRAVTGRSDQIAAGGAVQADVAGTQRLDGIALQQSWNGRFAAVAGARYDGITTAVPTGKRTAATVSPRLALRWDASPVTAFRAAYGTGLRAPYLNELIRGFRIGTTRFDPDPALVPERSRSLQAGIDVAHGSGRFAFDLTATRVADAIGFATISATVQRRANLGRTATDAFTAEYERSTGACSRVRAFAGINHDRAVTGTPERVGKRIAYVPDGTASFAYERTAGALTGALEVTYSGTAFADDLERQPLGAAVLAGVRLTARLRDGGAVSLGVENLTGTRYLTSIDRLGAPASVTLRISAPFGAARAISPAACAPR